MYIYEVSVQCEACWCTVCPVFESWIAVCEFESERRKGCHVQLCMTCIPTSRGLKFLAHCYSLCYLWYVRMCGIWSPLLHANVESCHLCYMQTWNPVTFATCKRGILPPLLHANIHALLHQSQTACILPPAHTVNSR